LSSIFETLPKQVAVEDPRESPMRFKTCPNWKTNFIYAFLYPYHSCLDRIRVWASFLLVD